MGLSVLKRRRKCQAWGENTWRQRQRLEWRNCRPGKAKRGPAATTGSQERFYPESQRGYEPTAAWFLVSKTGREYISSVQATRFLVPCYSHPRKQIQICSYCTRFSQYRGTQSDVRTFPFCFISPLPPTETSYPLSGFIVSAASIII